MGAPDYAYTDRDVREDESLQNVALAYLRGYGGTFEPLVEAKDKLGRGNALPVQTIRMVLNCMRHDMSVVDRLPVPNRQATFDYLDDFFTPPRKLVAVPTYVPPRRTETEAFVRYPYMMSRTGSLYHRVSPDKSLSTIFWEDGEPKKIRVKSLCKYPSFIVGPTFLKEAPSQMMQVFKGISYCKYCGEIELCGGMD